tara:strand:- start:19 stop:270 length:252 start_codon:yes stop_codon:yes gene_type:complete
LLLRQPIRYEPAGTSTDAAPSPSAIELSANKVQSVLPEVGVNVPSGHLKQNMAPSFLEYKPGEHEEQEAAPVSFNVDHPTGHV